MVMISPEGLRRKVNLARLGHWSQVRLKCAMNNEVYNGFLDEGYLDHNFAVIKVFAFLDVHDVVRCALDIVPHGEELLALGRGSSGQLMARIINFSVDLRASEEDDLHDKVWEGGPLFSFDGKFFGMNHSLTTRSVMFLPWGTIFKRLVRFGTSSPKKSSLAQSKISNVNSLAVYDTDRAHDLVAPVPRSLVNQEKLDVDSKGYPKLPAAMLGAGMVLVNTFEETFGDMFGKGFFIEWNGSMIVLTSASLVRNSGDGNEVIAGLRAGIGGPLVTLDGDVIGMNFYDRKIGTPFLYWKGIRGILALFEKKRILRIAGDDKEKLNMWPVPTPCWRHPDCFDEYESDDEEKFVPQSGNLSYFRGMKIFLY
ncbi:hypothetical protein C2845_PM15G09680 [Panicum miliaceum]|uniref:Uncharacterized protein n=1 Tax=Panicum miliaceum TaxID=4540 RepID=A0A3L6Q8B4_PANMI|nr:hypothetical protein C2845_PM15G09680 [Panicum miliaceum]